MTSENAAPANVSHAYRPDIDGLRAVAVLSVVVFHIFHGLVPGGFLGVDIFFVISGYLITKILVNDCNSGKYSIRNFYERRIRRIIPALLFTLIVVTLFAAFILLPTDLIGFAKSEVATIFFASNIYFLRDTNYFSSAAENKPLLHTWSLGVEEQFYIIFPIMVYFILKHRSERTLLAVLIVCSILSFVAATAAIAVNLRFFGFYLLPTRAWELGIGAIAVLAGSNRPPSRVVAGAAAGVGVIAVLVSLFVADQYFLAPLPAATLVCAGTALLLWAGQTPNLTGSVLSLKPMVAIGLISYSLYLWHWPIYSLSQYYLVRDLTLAESWGVLAASLIMAYVSWAFVERRFRARTMPMPRVLGWNAVPAAAIAAAVVLTVATQGLPSRFSAEAIHLNRNAGNIYKCPLGDWTWSGGTRACKINAAAGDPAGARIAMYGDSHALMYAPAFEGALASIGQPGLLFYTNGCQILIGVNRSQRCLDSQNANVRAVVDNPAIQVVVVAFSWVRLDLPAVDRQGHALGMLPPDRLKVEFDRLINAFRDAGKQVVVIGPIPHPGYDVASTTSREVAFYGAPRSPLRQSRDAFDMQFSRGERLIEELPAAITVLRPATSFCNTEECSFMLGKMMPYADSNHIVMDASRQFAPLFRQGIDRAMTQAANAPSPQGQSPALAASGVGR